MPPKPIDAQALLDGADDATLRAFRSWLIRSGWIIGRDGDRDVWRLPRPLIIDLFDAYLREQIEKLIG